MPDFRSLISRMADELDHYRQLLMDDRREVHALSTEARTTLAQPEPAGQIPPDYIDPQHTGADRELLQAFYAACQSEGGTVDEVTLRGIRAAIAAALAEPRIIRTDRAALAQPEPEGPTDEELLKLMPQQFRDDLATVSRMAAHGAGPDVGAGLFRVSLNTGALNFARAAIAADRAQRQPVPEGPTHRITPDDFRRWWRETGSASPAPSPEMLLTANAWAQYCLSRWGRPAPQPVPVSERLPGHIEQALIKAECALADIAEGEAEESDGDPLEWAEKRAADALARIRPVMRQHQIQTSEWPPVPPTP